MTSSRLFWNVATVCRPSLSTSSVTAHVASPSVAASVAARAEAREQRPLQREDERRRLARAEALDGSRPRDAVEELADRAPRFAAGVAAGRGGRRHQLQQLGALLLQLRLADAVIRAGAAGLQLRQPFDEQPGGVLLDDVGDERSRLGHGQQHHTPREFASGGQIATVSALAAESQFVGSRLSTLGTLIPSGWLTNAHVVSAGRKPPHRRRSRQQRLRSRLRPPGRDGIPARPDPAGRAQRLGASDVAILSGAVRRIAE